MRVLALDLATVTGWAAGDTASRPACGSVRLVGGAPVDRWLALWDWLDAAITIHDPREIVFEAPLVRSDNAARTLIGLSVVVELVARERSVRCTESNIAHTRKQIIGRGTFPKGEAKGAVVAWAKAEGFDPPDDNAADALVLWHYAAKVRGR